MKRSGIGFIFILSVLAFALFTSGCKSKSSNPSASHNDMLSGLGIDTNIGERTTPGGDEVPAGYNPTLRKKTQLAKRCDVFFAGALGFNNGLYMTPNNNEYNAILDWTGTEFDVSNIAGDTGWFKVPKAMASADVDGDGKDEIVIAYVTDNTVSGKDLVYRVVKNIDGVYTIIQTGIINSYLNASISPNYPDNSWWMNNFSVVCGDADGNGQSESMIAFNGTVFLLGDSSSGYGIKKYITYEKASDAAYIILKIASGDLDNNGTDEFVVVENQVKSDKLYGSAVYHLYAGVSLNEFETGSIIARKNATTVFLHTANCAVGDLDADGLNEILFVGLPENSSTYYMMVLNQTWNGSGFDFNFIPDYESFESRYSYTSSLTPVCAIADFDGNGKKEVYAYRYLYRFIKTSETTGSFSQISSVADVYAPTNTIACGSMWDSSLAIGDIDGDLKAEITYVSDNFWELYILGFDSSNSWIRKNYSTTANNIDGDIVDNGEFYPCVTIGDYDGDSIVVEFINSETLFSNPHPIAVLAANPFWSDIEMIDGETSFGKLTGSETTKEQKIGFSVGFSLAYESEGVFNAWDVSVKTTFEAAFDWSASQSVSIEESYSYSTCNSDSVIFTAVPYDVYYYKVISAPDQDMVDKIITVNLPRKPQTLKMEVSNYNAKNGDATDIDSTILTHVVGNPLTYPSSSDADSLIAASYNSQGIKSSSMLSVGQGNSANGIEMSISNTKGTGYEYNFSFNIEAEAGAGGFTAGVNAGFNFGENYSFSTTTGTFYGGSVGDIVDIDNYTGEYIFQWGLFSYQAAIGSEKFIVVNYYVSQD